MKKTLTAFALLLAAASLPASAATISLVVSSPVSAGSSFDVLVQASNIFAGRTGDLVIGYGFNVTVGNGAILSYTGEAPGPLFFDVASANPMVFGFSSDPAGIGVTGLTQPLTLATLHFQALATGTSSIGVTSATVTDPANGGLFYANLPDASIAASISLSPAVPEPSTLFTGGFAALVLLAALRRAAQPGGGLGRGITRHPSLRTHFQPGPLRGPDDAYLPNWNKIRAVRKWTKSPA